MDWLPHSLARMAININAWFADLRRTQRSRMFLFNKIGTTGEAAGANVNHPGSRARRQRRRDPGMCAALLDGSGGLDPLPRAGEAGFASGDQDRPVERLCGRELHEGAVVIDA